MYYQRSKWTNAKKSTYKGSVYDSGFEASIAMELDMRVKSGELTKWERQKTIPLNCNGYIVGTYKIDFVAYHADGRIEYIEAKGYATDVWKLRWKIFESMFQDQDKYILTIIKQKNNWNMRNIKKAK